MIKNVILVAIGGASGSVLRYIISVITVKYSNTIFPIATFSVNIIGCLLIGLFLGFLNRNNYINNDLYLVFVTGFCGGFTTFSAFAQENLRLIETNNIITATIYTLLSVIIGIFLVWLGYTLNK